MAYQLSPVNESDEAVSLFEVLSQLGGTGLTSKELWSICFQCTRILQDINKIGDFFQTLCITPESVAFEITSNQICLLDLYVDPDAKYVPPEYEKHGNSEKSHLYSLGRTLIEANGGEFDDQNDGLSNLICCLTAQSPEKRPTIQEVIDICISALQNESSEKICQELFDRIEENANKDKFVQINQSIKNGGKESENKRGKNGNSNFHSEENKREAAKQVSEKKPILVTKPCLKNRNGTKSSSKKKGPVSFSEANSLINLNITYHSPDENDGDNERDIYQNGNFKNSCQAEVTERHTQSWEVTEDNGPETRNTKIVQQTLQPIISNAKSELCIPEDIQDGSRPNFYKSNVDKYLVQNSGCEEGILGNSLVAGNSYSKCQNGHRYNSQSCENLKSCCKKDNSKITRCVKNPVKRCLGSNLDEEFSKDAECSHCCTSEMISVNPDMDVQSKNSGTKKWQISENEKFQRECSLGWADNQRMTKLRNSGIGKVPDSEMVDVSQRPDSSNGSPFLEDEEREISSEHSSVELVTLSHANRSFLWNFGNESPASNDQKMRNGNRNLVDLILGSKSEESINVHKKEMSPVFSENEKEDKVLKKPNDVGSEEEGKDRNSEFSNNDYDGDDDDDNSSLLGEIRKAKSLRGESVKQRLKRIKEIKATTLQDIIDVTGLDFDETELWALCREALLVLNKTKVIPSYLSLDVLSIQSDGHFTFIDPPPQKLIDTTFVAPEIQRKGKITEKTGIYGLGMVFRLAAGCKNSVSVSTLGMSDIMKNLLEDMTSEEENHRPTTNSIYELCEAHEKNALYSSQNICQSLYEECVQNLMDLGEGDTAGSTRKSDENENEENRSEEEKKNEKEENLKESKDDNCVDTSNQMSAFTCVANKRFEVTENSTNIPVSLNSSATYFKPIVLNDTRGQVEKVPEAVKDKKHWEPNDGNCGVNRNAEIPPQKPIPALGKRPGSSTETFVSASRRVVEKLRQLEEVYTKQTSKGNLVKANNKQSESEKAPESPGKERTSLQAKQSKETSCLIGQKETSCLIGQKDQSLGKKDVEELAEVILNKLQEKQTNFGQFSTLGLFGWNDLSLNNNQTKSHVPLMVMPTQRVMTVPFPYPPMMTNEQCAEDVHISSRFPVKGPPCPHCLQSSSPSVSHSETSSCQSDPNCCDSLEDDEEPQISGNNFQALRYHSDFKRSSCIRCSLCPSHGRRAQDLVHKLRSRRTKKPKEDKQPKCHCLNNKKWSSETSLQETENQYSKTETWPGHFDLTTRSSGFDYTSKGSPRKEEFDLPIMPNQNLSKSQPENPCHQGEISSFETSGKNSFNRSISEPDPSTEKKYRCVPFHFSGHHQSESTDVKVNPDEKHPHYHCECDPFIDNGEQGFSSSSTPNLTPEKIPISSSNETKTLEDQQKIKNGYQYHLKRDSGSLEINRFGATAESAVHHNGSLSIFADEEGNFCKLHNCSKTLEGICSKCPKIKAKTNSDSQEIFLETLCSSQTISEGTIKQLHLILKIMKIVQHHLENKELERNPDEDFVMGAGIASLKGLCWEKFKNSLTTMYPNFEWSEKCLQEIFAIINCPKENKNSVELDCGRKSLSNHYLSGNDNLQQTFGPSKSQTSLFLTEPKFFPGNIDSCEYQECAKNGEIPTSSVLTLKQNFEENIVRDTKGLSFDQGEVAVPLPKPAEESQFQLVKKYEDGPRELFKKKLKKQRHESEEKSIVTCSDSIKEDLSDSGGDGNKPVSDSEFFYDANTTTCGNGTEPEQFEGTNNNVNQSPFLEKEAFFSSNSSLEKEEFCEIQISLTDYKECVHVDADKVNTDTATGTSVVTQEENIGLSDVQERVTLKESPPEGEMAKKEKVSRHSSVMKRYRSYQESGSLLKVGIIPSSEADSDRSDFGPSHSASTEDGNGVDEDETPTCSSDIESSPISELSLDGDDPFSESAKAITHEMSPLSDEASVHSLEYFPKSEKYDALLPLLDGDSRVVYHSADLVRNSDNADVMTFLKGIDKYDFESLNARLKNVQQQLMLEGKEWQKMNRFYQNLQNKESWRKSNKSQITRVYNDLKESEETLNCLRLYQQHLELLIIEKCSIPHDLVHSITTCDGTKPLELIPHKENPYLHYHTISATDNTTGMDTYVLNAGFPRALFANLYTQVALAEGIIHQFFYCYRYFSSPQQLFTFLISTYTASKRCLQSEEANIVQERTLLLLLWWIKDYYSIDFNGNTKLCKMAQEFIEELPKDEKRVSDINTVWYVHTSGNIQELMSTAPKQSFVYTVSCLTKKNRLSSMSASDWDLRPSFQGEMSPLGKSRDWPIDHTSPTHNNNSRYSPQGSLFSFNDQSPEILAEQLTLIEQELFQRVHPVQFLNSKYNGFNTSLTIPGWNNPRSIRNKQNSATNLFVSEIVPRCLSVETQIRHAHQISHWVGAELISASSSRTQASLLTKFLNIAQCCTKIQNFATGMAILDGLENALVRQLPTWKELSNKSLNIFTNLKTFKNSDCIGMSSEKSPIDKTFHPVIPSILPYLLNVQQCEIGSFTLTNGMCKWTKIRHITRAIDPIRVFRQYKYPFKPIHYLQKTIKQRIEQTCHQDLNVLAREHSSYDDKMSFPVHGKNNFQRAMKRIRDKLKTNK